MDLFYSMVPEVADVAGGQPVLIYQGITEPMLNNMKKHGDSPFGLAASPGPTVSAFVNKFMDKAIAEAKSVSVFN
ncbi:hypothetical protein PENFLA_c001G01123 [Penicillium flavigenum]|uniref:Uncharacterized protein n=1 Tax=Penicillium flavigenum TaxID=254877 RepID=A0A1V6U3H0_9EURO|nr:hypothetical protein PENFLA_c001G01123 [Penicillium flavigenum]